MTDALTSAGARLERKAIRNYLRRAIAREPLSQQNGLRRALAYVMTRQDRYDKKPGGLGEK